VSRRGELDRAALALGATAVASLAFVVVRGRAHFVQMDAGAVALTVGLAGLAVAAGLTGRSLLAVVAGAGYVTASVGLVVTWAADSLVVRGNGSTASLWLGLGLGLLATGLAGRFWPPAREGGTDGPR
jgi:hypothetical protein